MTLNPDEIQAILGALQEAEWDQAVVIVDDVTISVSRNGVAPSALPPGSGLPAPTAVPAAPTPSAVPSPVPVPAPALAIPGAIEGERRITAPSVGVLWRAPEPGAPPFVTVGQHVEAGDTLCIVEVMKLMNNVTTDVAGTVTWALVENGQNVEFDSLLFTIRED
jgi:acetyl-CoA carboxylase biotin carboxyl carrier protein